MLTGPSNCLNLADHYSPPQWEGSTSLCIGLLSQDGNHAIQTHQLSNKENGFCHENKSLIPWLLGKCTHNWLKGLHNTAMIEEGRKDDRKGVNFKPLGIWDWIFLKYSCKFFLTLRSLFAVHPHSTVARPPMCAPVPELSVEWEVWSHGYLHADTRPST